jgi:hypothetical protein
MGFFTSKKKTTTDSKERAYLPGWVQDPMKDAVQMAVDASGQGFQEYTDPRFAGLNPDELAAYDQIRALQGTTEPWTQQALSTTSDVMRQGLEGIDPALLQSYMNPYQQQVLDAQLASNLRGFDRSKGALGLAQAQRESFGGARSAIESSLLEDNFQRRQAEQEAGLRYQGFTDAMAGAERGLTRAGQGAVNMSNIAGQGLGLGLQEAGALSGIGAQQRGLEQQGLDFDFSEFMRRQAQPYQDANFLMGQLSTPGQLMRGSNSHSTTTSKSTPSGFSTALGIASMAMGIPGVGAGMAGGLGSMMGGMGMSGGMAKGIGNALGGFGGGSTGANFFQNAGLAANPGQMGPYSPFNPSIGRNDYNEGGLVSKENMYNTGTLGAPVGLNRLPASWIKSPSLSREYPAFTPMEAFGMGLKDITGGVKGFFDTERMSSSPSDTRLDKFNKGLANLVPGAIDAIETGITAPSNLAAGGLQAAHDYLTEVPDSEVVGQGMMTPSKKPAPSPEIVERFSALQEAAGIKAQPKPAKAAPTTAAKSSGSMTYEDILAKVRKETSQSDAERAALQRKAMFMFGASLLGDTGMEKAVDTYRGIMKDGEVVKMEKEKAIQDMAAQHVQKLLNERQVAAQEQKARYDAQMLPYEMELKKAQMIEALRKAGGNAEDVKNSLTLYESNPLAFTDPASQNVDVNKLLSTLGGLKGGSTATTGGVIDFNTLK